LNMLIPMLFIPFWLLCHEYSLDRAGIAE
jgi:hypothetical protein